MFLSVGACSLDDEGASQRGSIKSKQNNGSTEMCPITLPNGSAPPGEAADQDSEEFHGNEKLWTSLWPYGVVIATGGNVERDGSIRMKFPWWTASGLESELVIHGRRLDAKDSSLRTNIEPGGGGVSGPAFWAVEFIFASEGCWEVTGKAGHTRLTAVMLVLEACALTSTDGQKLPEPIIFTSQTCRQIRS